MVVHAILQAEHIIPTDIVHVQAEVIILIQRNQVALLHHVHAQLVKVHPMVVTVLGMDM